MLLIIYLLHCSCISFASKTNFIFKLVSVAGDLLYWRIYLLLCLNSNLKNKRNSSEVLEAHLQPFTHREIMRLLKNTKTKKEEKLVYKRKFLSGSWDWCIYSRAALTVQGDVPCWWPSIETEGVVWHLRPFTQTPGFGCRVILTTLPVCN